MQYYFFVIMSAFLFAMQFLCQQKYEEECGTGIDKALGFSLYKGLTVVVMMVLLSAFKIEFAWYTVIMSGLYAISYILMAHFSLKAFSVANLSVYSVFTMLGGMLLPFIIGVSFYKEELSVLKVICCLIVVAAVLMNIQKGNGSKKAFLYYILVFLLNGSIASISKIHESAGFTITGPQSFMFYSGIWTIVICSICLLKENGKIELFKGKKLLYSAGDGFLNGIGDLLLLISIAKLDASVQYPLVTGGVMVFSTLISITRREKIRTTEYIAAVLALVASVLMAF